MAASPCIAVCRMSFAKETCEGCYRTLEEIAAWRDMGEAGQQAVLAAVALRRAAAMENISVKV